MDFVRDIFGFLLPAVPMSVALVAGVLVLIGLRKLLDRHYVGQTDRAMKTQLFMLLSSFVLLVIVIVVAPLPDQQKGQILSLVGIVLSAAIALSSTTFVGNAMAGMMMSAVKGFRVGDFIAVGDDFGRVTERGLFHVEMQTERRDLITLPNLHLVTNPVQVIRTSGTLVTAEVSLGYDVPRERIRRALLVAGEQAGLQDTFVHVTELGDFSVGYRVAGLLTEVKLLLSTRSRLRECVLDALHAADIEIVSPNFMNTRQAAPGDRCIPAPEPAAAPEPAGPSPEELVFDKAEEAETVEQQRMRLAQMDQKIAAQKQVADDAPDDAARQAAEDRLQRMKKARDVLAARLTAATEDG